MNLYLVKTEYVIPAQPRRPGSDVLSAIGNSEEEVVEDLHAAAMRAGLEEFVITSINETTEEEIDEDAKELATEYTLQ